MPSVLCMLADHTLFFELSLSFCSIFLLPLCWMHVTERLADKGLVHRKCPNGEAGVSLWATVSFWKLLSWAAPMKERHSTILAHTVLSFGHLEITLLYNFLSLSKFWKCVVLWGERSGGHHCIHRAHMTTRPNSHVTQQQEEKQCSEEGRQRVLAVWGGSPQ